MANNLYARDILKQPGALRSALESFDSAALAPLAGALSSGKIDRIILTGMGASYYAAYPASLILARSGLPVMWLDTAELIHYGRSLLSPRTLLWAVSQSGRSAEMLALLERLSDCRPPALLAMVNDPQSPLAQAASLALPLNAEPEQTVSTRTYLNTLALSQLAALRLVGEDLAQGRRELEEAADSMQAYLESWQARLEQIASRVGEPGHLVLLGRGPSLASACCGALVLQEAVKFPAWALGAAEFRHGPLEIARPGLSALLFAGPPQTRALNLRLFDDLRARAARPFWLDPQDGATPESPAIPPERRLPMPAAHGLGLPLAEIAPVQLLSLHLGRLAGVEPGEFLHIGKVTLVE
ncbi:MAG: SIS domain-containing protein [Anaerolineales bacterium]|nr:SIS domain-containing protein [Anaerolineales bacterium]